MAVRTSRKSAKATAAGTNSEGLSGSKAEAQTAKPGPIDGARPEGTDAHASPPNPAETGQASAAAPDAAAAGSALPAGVTVTGERLAAFEVRSNVLGSHGFVEPGGTVIVNRTDFEALKAAGVVAGEWPEQEVSAG